MKIGIIGLKGRQVNDLQGRKFNGHELEFYSEKSYAQDQVASFTRKMDMVILLPQHAPKRIADWIIKSKLKTMAGSISTVIRFLETLPHEHADIKPLEVKPVVHAKPEPVRSVVNEQEAVSLIKPPKALATILPGGYDSQYTWSPNEAVIETDEKGKHRYDVLDAAVPGDVLRYARPAGVDLATWKVRMYAVRQQRAKKKQLIEFHLFDEYVDLLVVQPDGQLPKAAAESVQEATQPAPVAEATVVAAPTPKAPVESENGFIEMMKLYEADRQHWYGLLVAAITSGKSPEDAAVIADKGMVEFRKRCLL